MPNDASAPGTAGVPPALPQRSQHSGQEDADVSDIAGVPATLNLSRQSGGKEDAGETPAVPRMPAVPCTTHKLWHSRGYLPHFDSGAIVQFITFRLADSLPKHVVDAMPDEEARRKSIERAIDEGRGACFLRDPKIAAIVGDAFLHFDGQRYRLIAWVIMPNHVHVLIEQHKGFPLGETIHAWKSYTAKQANKALSRSGAFWAPDYFDRYVRNDAHFLTAIRYIHQNPVKAGLVGRPEDWPFSSAGI